MASSTDVPTRDEIDDRYKWRLEDVYDNREQWKDDVARVQEHIDEITAYKGQVTTDADTLLTVLELDIDIDRTLGKILFYVRARMREDTTDDAAQAMVAQARSLAAQANSARSFIEPAIKDAGEDRIRELLDENAELQTYDHFFDDLFRLQEHMLPADQEQLLSNISEVLGHEQDVQELLLNADMQFPTVATPDGDEVTVTHDRLMNLLQHRDRAFREDVHTAFEDAVTQFDHTLANNYQNLVKTNVKLARVRGYDSARERALDGNNIPVTVYDNLLHTVEDRLDLLHRQLELRSNVLDVDTLRPWDLHVPLATSEQPDIPFDAAVDHVLEALAPLGEDYVETVQNGIENGWVDVYPTQGKRSGAFSAGAYDTHPYVLMNYTDDVDSLYTLAHELGHAMHSHYTNNNQPYVYSQYPIFTAEVASTVHEALLTEHLLETADDPLREHVVSQQATRIEATLFTQAMFAAFEHRAHQLVEDGEALTVEVLDQLYEQLLEQYRKPVALADTSAKGWLRIPHFYRAFYVYQYATGISAALTLAQDIRENNAAEQYLKFLQSGASDYPLKLLQATGVDLTTTKPVDSALDRYKTYVDTLEDTLQ